MLTEETWAFTRLVEHVDFVPESHPYGVGERDGIRIVRYQVERAGSFGVHVERGLHQLAWHTGGDLAVFAADEFHLLPPSQCIWIPAGTPHDIACTAPGELFCLYLREEASPFAPSNTPVLVAADDLMRGLMRHLASPLTKEEGLRARAVLLDALPSRVHVQPTLPMPSDPVARMLAEQFLETPAVPPLLEQAAQSARISARTLQRRFVAETGLTYREWKTRARLSLALPLLEAAKPVKEVAWLVGYATPSAFISAYAAEFGVTPGRGRMHEATAL